MSTPPRPTTSQATGKYQIRSLTMGVFQGECLGLAFFYNPDELSDEQMPEQGIYVFDGMDVATETVAYIAEHGNYHREHPDDLVVEPLDLALQSRMFQCAYEQAENRYRTVIDKLRIAVFTDPATNTNHVNGNQATAIVRHVLEQVNQFDPHRHYQMRIQSLATEIGLTIATEGAPEQ